MPVKLTSRHRKLLQPYEGLLGELNDAEIASQLGLKAEIVTAYRASLKKAPAAHKPAPETTAAAPAAPAQEEGGNDSSSQAQSSEERAHEQRQQEVDRIRQAMDHVFDTYVRTGKAPEGHSLAEALSALVGVASEAEAAAPTTYSGAKPPHSVRVKKKRRIKGPDNRTWVLGFRDIYSGERAAWLWTHHRALVEPYTP